MSFTKLSFFIINKVDKMDNTNGKIIIGYRNSDIISESDMRCKLNVKIDIT